MSRQVCAAIDNIKFESFGVDSGLSQQVVQTVFQDSKGFLWVGTQEGLNRYDGFKFRQYLHERGNKDSLSDAWIRSISEDIYGNLWVGTTAGLNILNNETNKFLRISENEQNSHQFVGKTVFEIWRDKSNNMWVLSDKGLNKHDRVSNTFTHIPLTIDGKSVNAVSVFQDVDYGIWIVANGSSLHFLAKDSVNIQSVPLSLQRNSTDNETLGKEISDYSIGRVFIDSKRRLWVATKDDGMFISNDALHIMPKLPDHITFHSHASDINADISKILEDSDGTIWFTSVSDGIFYLTQEQKIGHLTQ
ncbi:MAG: two-component regulator propeller domain-containing protein, partial [Pseudomonadota bacterium]